MDILKTLKNLCVINKNAFSAVLVGSILGIMIGAIMLVVSYSVISPLITVMNTSLSCANVTLGCSGLYNSSQTSITTITQALNIVGIGLIITGVAGIIYILLGVAGNAGGRQ
jgi:uncharacterized membrane protein YjgN (DUF898 family)